MIPDAFKLLVCVVSLLRYHGAGALECSKVDACTCEMSDGTGKVNLNSLANTDGTPRFYDVTGSDHLQYSYNPCKPFTEKDCRSVAVCQIYSSAVYSAGNQDSAKFTVDSSGKLQVAYTDIYTKSVVDFICDKGAKEPVFKAIGDRQATNTVKLSLTHVCACAGMCDAGGIVAQGGGISFGTILCILLLVGIVVYLIVGAVVNFWFRHLSGKQVIPHVDFWTALPEFTKDGFVFTYNTIRSKTSGANRGSYTQL